MYPGAKQTLFWGDVGHNRSPLHEAVWHGHVETVKVLLESEADPNLVENDGGSPLHEAAYCGEYGKGKEEARKKRRKVHQISETEIRGNGSSGIISLEDEVSQEATNRLKIMELLLNTSRCSVDMVESHGCTPLWYAVCQGWTSAVEILIKAGASTNPFEYNSPYQPPSSPLMISLKQRFFKTARMLIQHDATLMPSETECFVPDEHDLPVDIRDAMVQRVNLAAQKPSSTTLGNAIEGTPCDTIPRNYFAWRPSQQLL